MPTRTSRSQAHVVKDAAQDKPVLPWAKPAHKIKVRFECWSCREGCEVDLSEIQQDRVAIKYDEVKPNPNKQIKYYIKCTACKRFNSVII